MEVPGFDSLYVRKGPRLFHDVGMVHRVLDLASICVVSTQRGKGLFTSLVTSLRTEYPELTLYVENVLNPRFAAYLPKIGFMAINQQRPDACFVMFPAGTRE